MSRRSYGSAVAAIGIIVLAVAALADQIGIGDADAFGWKQIVGVVVGTAIAVSGFFVAKQGERTADGVDKEV